MRFRAILLELQKIQQFTRIAQTISRIAKDCILRLTKDKIYFIQKGSISNGGIAFFCELPQNHFFEVYELEGLSPEHNEIYVEIITENFLRALKVSQNAQSIKIKLTKKLSPCLTFEVKLPSRTASTSRIVTHDVPVHVIAQRIWYDYLIEAPPQFDVSIYYPNVKIMKAILERMKNINNYVLISANHNGEIKVAVETYLVNVTTYFSEMIYPNGAKGGIDNELDLLEFNTVRVDNRKLSQLFTYQQIHPNEIICNIVDNETVHLYFLHDDVTFHYIMPAVCT